MSEEHLIRHCAPTLAAIKTASLFTCPFHCKEALLDSLRQLNKKLSAKGLRLLPLRFSDKKVLLYLYRPAMLRRDFSEHTAAELLRQNGYDPDSCERSVCRLARKLRAQKAFPHEIGLFLGYPAEDVLGFIRLGPDCCKCTGCWKVYGNEDAARKTFAQYKNCTKVYCDCWAKGVGMEQLTVSD